MLPKGNPVHSNFSHFPFTTPLQKLTVIVILLVHFIDKLLNLLKVIMTMDNKHDIYFCVIVYSVVFLVRWQSNGYYSNKINQYMKSASANPLQ